jgi:hypothetical protein
VDAAQVLKEAKEARILTGNKGESADDMASDVMAKKIRTQIQVYMYIYRERDRDRDRDRDRG